MKTIFFLVPPFLIMFFCGCSKSNTELYTEAIHGNVKSLSLYVQNGGNVDSEKLGGLLSMAVKKNSIVAVTYLLKNGANPNLNTTNSPSVLMLAAAYSSPNVVDLLLHYGADVKKSDEMGHNVIWYAVEGNPENIYLLAKAGADINHVDKNGETPLQRATNDFKLQLPRYAAISTLIMLDAASSTNETNELIRAMLKTKLNSTRQP